MKNISYSLIDIYAKDTELCADLVYGLNYGGVKFEYNICVKTSPNRVTKDEIQCLPELWTDFLNISSTKEFNNFKGAKEKDIRFFNDSFTRGTRFYLDVVPSDNNLVNFYLKSEKLAIEKLIQNKDKIFRLDDINKALEAINKFTNLYIEALNSPEPGISMKKIIDDYNVFGSFGEYTSFNMTIKEQKREVLAKELNQSLSVNFKKDNKSKL